MNHDYFKGIDWVNLRNNPAPYNPIKRPVRNLKTTASNVEKCRISASFSKINDDQSPLLVTDSPMGSPVRTREKPKL